MAVAMLGFAWNYERTRGHPLFAHWAGPEMDRLRKLVRIGAPAAGQILLEVGAWNLSTFAAGYLTPVALATHTIALNYASVSYMVPLGIGAAAAVSVGHAIGAGDPARARRAGWLALALGTGFMVCAGVVFLVAPRPLILLYTHDARVLAVGPSLLWIAAAFQIFDGIQTVSTGALRGLGETRVPMLANLVGYWVMGLPLGFILCFVLKWGINGMWIGLTLSLIVIALALLARWKRDAMRVVLAPFKNIGLVVLREAWERGPRYKVSAQHFHAANRRCCERYLRYKGVCLEAVRVTRSVTIITIERSLSLSNAFFQNPALRSQGSVIFATARLQRSRTA